MTKLEEFIAGDRPDEPEGADSYMTESALEAEAAARFRVQSVIPIEDQHRYFVLLPMDADEGEVQRAAMQLGEWAESGEKFMCAQGVQLIRVDDIVGVGSEEAEPTLEKLCDCKPNASCPKCR